ncbi:MAG: hypothetical protein PHE33_11810 [Bacteroidales bacterium]|nr:hypothetical protein [Bacteroidales bacterium]
MESNIFQIIFQQFNISRWVGKKTALLQTLVVCWLVGFANVLFCVLAFFLFISCDSMQQKFHCHTVVVFFLGLLVTPTAMFCAGLVTKIF